MTEVTSPPTTLAGAVDRSRVGVRLSEERGHESGHEGGHYHRHDDLPRVLTQELMEFATAIDLIGNAAAERIGINQTDLICLELLLRNGPMSAGQVAAALGLTTAAISAMATRLEAGGFAQREMDPTDRRRVLLRASPAGAEKAYSLFDDLYGATSELFAEYRTEDLERLLGLIRRFRQLIAEYATTLRSGPKPDQDGPRTTPASS
jgi:DNA-binding MarR family transcriptional regulator